MAEFYVQCLNPSVGLTAYKMPYISYRSWQTVTFDPLPVTFIRIVGTHNTANEVRVSKKKKMLFYVLWGVVAEWHAHSTGNPRFRVRIVVEARIFPWD